MNLDVPNSKGKTIRDYLPEAMQKLMGKPEGVDEQSSLAPTGVETIDKKAVEKAAETLRD